MRTTLKTSTAQRQSNASRTGRDGEAAAARVLEAQGYRILSRNCRLSGAELDIVAYEDGCLVVIEVKTRRSRQFGSPLEAVDSRKQQRLIAAALEYMATHKLELPLRFDVAAVVVEQGTFRVEIVRNAFEGSEAMSL